MFFFRLNTNKAIVSSKFLLIPFNVQQEMFMLTKDSCLLQSSKHFSYNGASIRLKQP